MPKESDATAANVAVGKRKDTTSPCPPTERRCHTMDHEQTASYSVRAHYDRQALRRRRRVLDVVFLIFVICNFGLMSYTLDTSARDAETINVAGRQRSISQRIGLLASQLDKDLATDARLGILAEISLELETLRRNHTRLIESSHIYITTSLRPALDEAYYGPDGLNVRLESFEQLVETLLREAVANPVGSASERELRGAIQKLALRSLEDPDSLLHAQNSVVSLYELAYGAKLKRTQWLLVTVTLLALAIGVAASLLIFNPAMRQSEENMLAIESERRRLVQSTQRTVGHLRELLENARRALAKNRAPSDDGRTPSALSQLIGEIELQVDDLDGVSANSSGGVHSDRFLVAALVDGAITNQSKRDYADGVQIERHIESDKTIEGNQQVLRSSLEYLIANAMIFCDPSELVPMVSIYVEYPSPDTCAITVRDNGIGVASEERDKLFTPRSNERGFVGVGLSLVHQNLQACGANISYTPVIGGSSFEIRFPVQSSVLVAA